VKILESIQHYTEFKELYQTYDWLIVPVYCSENVPAIIDNLSVIYIYVLLADVEIIIPINHTEATNVDLDVSKDLPVSNKLYVYNKKKFLNFCTNINLFDIDLLKYFQTNDNLADEYDTNVHIWFARHFENFKNINTIIPILKHYEKCNNIRNDFFNYVTNDLFETDSYELYNKYILETLHKIEQSGLYVNFNTFSKHFLETQYYDGYTYTEYNPYTTTGRPSNRYARINFAALNKESGCRAAFTSRFGTEGFLINIDFDAYHIRLIADLVNYTFPNNISVHNYLGQMYFNTDELTTEQYEQSKQISFKLIYGGSIKDYLHIDFFNSINDYTKKLWVSYNKNGYIESPVFKRKLYKTFFTDMNASKLLNYLLQIFETERNMKLLHEILSWEFKSKIILYTYDSILIDFNKSDGAQFIKKIKEFLEGISFPVKISIGPDYQNLTSVTQKIL
jgi:hypothetical protein